MGLEISDTGVLRGWSGMAKRAAVAHSTAVSISSYWTLHEPLSITRYTVQDGSIVGWSVGTGVSGASVGTELAGLAIGC